MQTEQSEQAGRCVECGRDFVAVRRAQHFCGAACRKSFNSRRATRGAELYDLFMALRYARGWSKAQGVWQIVCRLAAEWRAEDEQAGRESYVLPERWLQQNRAAYTNTRHAARIGRPS